MVRNGQALEYGKKKCCSVDLLGFRSLRYPKSTLSGTRSGKRRLRGMQKNNHRHIVDISESRSSLTGGLFFSHNAEIGRKGRKSMAHV
jgi:hypothetical protein